MTQQTWTAVDSFLSNLLLKPDPALDAALAASDAAGLPAINVSPTQGKLLHLLARAIGAQSILEVGTLGGYSTIWLARALKPGGRLITLEYDPKHAEVARANVARAGLADIVEVRVGRAIDALPQLAAEGRGPFDLVFIDADKPSTADYFAWAVKLTRPGSLIIVDNVVRKGGVLDAESANAVTPTSAEESGVRSENLAEAVNIRGIRRFLEAAAAEPRVEVTALQTVGAKGYDGFALALVK